MGLRLQNMAMKERFESTRLQFSKPRPRFTRAAAGGARRISLISVPWVKCTRLQKMVGTGVLSDLC